ncbi:PorP/SprF family type IX secretion system membrane protein [Rufibacter roseus]|uniref:PorP/SprF family type IX secretion system membrane protein n=1 Tax=Rufibacter roseus TaxID=1567108 RepID=A0ABW2DQA8_9BACT|nr:PorP/SprF family type IX secretion system membrane protein [Rufibacter roseus]
MKKLTLSICIFLSALGASAQGRKSFSDFTLLRQFYNPALTGYGGSSLKMLYRDQWTGFENAPRTLFASAEMGSKELSSWAKGEEVGVETTRNSWGLFAMHDEFGPFADSRVGINYGSRARLSEGITLRVGGAATYSLQRLRSQTLILDNPNDPEMTGYLGQDGRSSRFDLALGIALTGEDFYLGYGVRDATGGYEASGDGFLEDANVARHSVQAGVRRGFSESIGVVLNGVYHYDRNDKGLAEGQAKLVFRDMVWLGAGYRQSLAYSFTGGLQLSRFRVGYSYEKATEDAQYMSRPSNEFSLSYSLFNKSAESTRKLTVW